MSWNEVVSKLAYTKELFFETEEEAEAWYHENANLISPDTLYIISVPREKYMYPMVRERNDIAQPAKPDDSSTFTVPADEWDEYIATIQSPPTPTESLKALLRDEDSKPMGTETR